MGRNSITDLPWFIQHEIMDLVLSSNKEYRLLDPSCYKYTIAHYDEIHISYVNKFTSLDERNIENIRSVQLDSSDEDQLILLSRFMNIEKFNINISYFCAENPELINPAMLGLPALKSLSISEIFDSPVNDFKSLIKNQCSSLEELVLYTGDKDHLNIINGEIFPNLTSFSFAACGKPFPINDFSTTMPCLKGLHYQKTHYHDLPDQLMIHLKLLKVSTSKRRMVSVGSIDLSLYPSLTKLVLNGKYEYTTPPERHCLIDLSLDHLNKSLRSNFLDVFSSLSTLTMLIKNFFDEKYLQRILRLSTGLVKLSLQYAKSFGCISMCPKSVVPIKALKISGFLKLDEKALSWISSCLDLVEFNIDASNLVLEDPLINFNLHHLLFVTIKSIKVINLDQLENYFATNTRSEFTTVRVEFYILPEECPGCKLIVH